MIFFFFGGGGGGLKGSNPGISLGCRHHHHHHHHHQHHHFIIIVVIIMIIVVAIIIISILILSSSSSSASASSSSSSSSSSSRYLVPLYAILRFYLFSAVLVSISWLKCVCRVGCSIVDHQLRFIESLRYSKLGNAVGSFASQMIWILQCLYHNQTGVVRDGAGDSKRFDIFSGVRHGCVLSPRLFCSGLELAMSEWKFLPIQKVG